MDVSHLRFVHGVDLPPASRRSIRPRGPTLLSPLDPCSSDPSRTVRGCRTRSVTLSFLPVDLVWEEIGRSRGGLGGLRPTPFGLCSRKTVFNVSGWGRVEVGVLYSFCLCLRRKSREISFKVVVFSRASYVTVLPVQLNQDVYLIGV